METRALLSATDWWVDDLGWWNDPWWSEDPPPDDQAGSLDDQWVFDSGDESAWDWSAWEEATVGEDGADEPTTDAEGPLGDADAEFVEDELPTDPVDELVAVGDAAADQEADQEAGQFGDAETPADPLEESGDLPTVEVGNASEAGDAADPLGDATDPGVSDASDEVIVAEPEEDLGDLPGDVDAEVTGDVPGGDSDAVFSGDVDDDADAVEGEWPSDDEGDSPPSEWSARDTTAGENPQPLDPPVETTVVGDQDAVMDGPDDAFPGTDQPGDLDAGDDAGTDVGFTTDGDEAEVEPDAEPVGDPVPVAVTSAGPAQPVTTFFPSTIPVAEPTVGTRAATSTGLVGRGGLFGFGTAWTPGAGDDSADSSSASGRRRRWWPFRLAD